MSSICCTQSASLRQPLDRASKPANLDTNSQKPYPSPNPVNPTFVNCRALFCNRLSESTWYPTLLYRAPLKKGRELRWQNLKHKTMKRPCRWKGSSGLWFAASRSARSLEAVGRRPFREHFIGRKGYLPGRLQGKKLDIPEKQAMSKKDWRVGREILGGVRVQRCIPRISMVCFREIETGRKECRNETFKLKR